MKLTKPRTNLKDDVKEALAEIYQQLCSPIIILKLINSILTREEVRRVGRDGIDMPTSPTNWVSIRKILEVVAQQRQLTIKRALLELARSLDILGVGQYEQLRRAIGQPVVPERHDVPKWNPEARELRYKGKVVRLLAASADKPKQILDAFQADCWPTRIDSPLTGGKNSRRMRGAVQTLNNGIRGIKFFCDGKGEGIFWQEAS